MKQKAIPRKPSNPTAPPRKDELHQSPTSAAITARHYLVSFEINVFELNPAAACKLAWSLLSGTHSDDPFLPIGKVVREDGEIELIDLQELEDLEEFAKGLASGDEVTWTDPDAGLCSWTGKIAEIEFIGHDSARITNTDGWKGEVLLSELS
jgi:hypothetical protein